MRIIAGRFRGRALAAPSGMATRPTSSRARGALFEILRPRLEGASVADLFAGTGALGLEALSRGARRVDFYEAQRSALATLQKNVTLLEVAAQTRIVSGQLPEAISGGEAYDLVFIDPPWRQGLELAVAARLVARRRLAPGSLVIIESARGAPPELPGFAELGLLLDDQRTYGDTALHFFAPSAEKPLQPTDRRPS